jgi:hypothetical protein
MAPLSILKSASPAFTGSYGPYKISLRRLWISDIQAFCSRAVVAFPSQKLPLLGGFFVHKYCVSLLNIGQVLLT